MPSEADVRAARDALMDMFTYDEDGLVGAGITRDAGGDFCLYGMVLTEEHREGKPSEIGGIKIQWNVTGQIVAQTAGASRSESCPLGPHRGPQGPNEDVAQCPRCWSVSYEMRPRRETFGDHLPDCSLDRWHESYCQGGGEGHPSAEVIRG